jgi:hypothetical protein
VGNAYGVKLIDILNEFKYAFSKFRRLFMTFCLQGYEA